MANLVCWSSSKIDLELQSSYYSALCSLTCYCYAMVTEVYSEGDKPFLPCRVEGKWSFSVFTLSYTISCELLFLQFLWLELRAERQWYFWPYWYLSGLPSASASLLRWYKKSTWKTPPIIANIYFSAPVYSQSEDTANEYLVADICLFADEIQIETKKKKNKSLEPNLMMVFCTKIVEREYRHANSIM